MARKKLGIDLDLWIVCREYVHKQLDTMRRHNCAASLTPQELDDLIHRVATYPQEIRNLTIKDRRKRKLPLFQGFSGPDGNSLLCLICQAFQYITVVDDKATCPNCCHRYKWPGHFTEVTCASPDHNDGCTNQDCFNFRGPQ